MVLKKYNLSANFIPTKFTSESLLKELQDVKNKKILLARGDLATQTLVKELGKKGAEVINISMYKTEIITSPNEKLEEFLLFTKELLEL